MRTRHLLIGCAAVLLSGAAPGQIPPGYRMVRITDSPQLDRWAHINNRGQVVFYTEMIYNVPESTEIFLWENGRLTRITDDDVPDAFPDINDDGTIVWMRNVGPWGRYRRTGEIAVYRDGQITLLTDNALDDGAPAINNLGHVVWSQWPDERYYPADLMFYDGSEIRRLTSDAFSNQAANLNDFDDIVWTQFNFRNNPWTSEIMMYSGGVITQLTHGDIGSNTPDIDNRRRVAWFFRDRQTGEHRIRMWQTGNSWLLTDWGSGPRLNDRADVAFDRWHYDTSLWQAWLWRDGRFWQLTNDSVWSWVTDLNDRGDIVGSTGDYRESVYDVYMVQRLPLGDLNCDGRVDNFDVDPFVLALTDADAYGAGYPGCDRTLADINEDGSVDNFDIDPFVEILTR